MLINLFVFSYGFQISFRITIQDNICTFKSYLDSLAISLQEQSLQVTHKFTRHNAQIMSHSISIKKIGIWLTHSLFLRNYNGLVEPCFFGEHPYHFATSVCHKQVGHFLSAGGSVFTFKFAHLQGVLVINDILD